MRIVIQQVSYIAELARLQLAPAEEERLAGQLNASLEYMGQFAEVDTAGVEPTSHVLPLTNVLREDERCPSLPNAEARANAPAPEQGHFAPALIQLSLVLNGAMAALGQRFAKSRDCLYLGRGVNFPVALEGALKLKEISCVHAEGYAGGEMKHGPIALIEEELPVVVLAPCDESFAKMHGNLEEVRARRGIVIAFTDRAGKELAARADHLYTAPLQLFACRVADARGHDVDQPRNLAKSVTVE